jgi:uncharacterized membrane protein YphA (DoxX/SURF4 family)
MSDHVRGSITMLRIVFGTVVLVQSVQALLPRETSRHGELIARILPVLAGVEILGALLILVPRTARIGAWTLIPVFAVAALLHVLHGSWNVGGLVVYAACAGVVLASAGGPRLTGAAA